MDLTCFNWVQIIKKDTDLSFHAKGLAMYLATFMNLEHDAAWPSITRISNELSISRPTVIKYTKELVANGYMIITKERNLSGGGEQDYNKYTIDIPLKVVKELNHLVGKVVNDRTKGSKPHTSKVVNHVNPNNNINNNIIIEKFPHWSDSQAWVELGEKTKHRARPGESQNDFQNRLKRTLS